MRISALPLALAAACSGPMTSPRATAPASPATATAPVPAAAPLPVIVLDTSVKTIWGIDPHAPIRDAEPFPPEPAPELDRVARPAPRARLPGRRAPCFPKRDVLVASEVFRDLVAYSLYMGADTDPPPKRRYGTCTVEAGKLTDARGMLVADIHCGLTVHVPGIIDDLGFEVGAFGIDVAAALPDKLMCWSEDTVYARCWGYSVAGTDDDASETRAHYSFKATIEADAVDGGMLRGDEARSVFEGNRVAYFTQRMYCH